jgi:hypothetical protein
MHKGTLKLNTETSQPRIELPTDYIRLLQSITLLAPALKVSLDIDVTHKAVLPAVLESALLLVAQIETVSPVELGNFFGLEDHERQVLVSEMIDTGLVRFNDDGDISTTTKLNMQRREGAADEGIAIEDVENFRDFTFVDLCTGHIQPKCSEELQKGLPDLPRKVNLSDFTEIISEQFIRFQACLPDIRSKQALRNPKARLYRVNRASVAQSGLKQQVSLDIHAHHDPLKGIRLDAKLLHYKSDHATLMENSGLKTEAMSWLHTRSHDIATTTLEDYCDLARDDVIRRYIKRNGTLDLGRLLHDRQRKKTGYGNSTVQRMIIGPIYAASNRATLTKWAERHSKKERMHQGIWLGATNELFGASLGLESFIKKMNEDLNIGERNSCLNLAFHADSDDYNKRKRINNMFGRRTDDKLRVFARGKSESHLEFIVFPGEKGIALIQYHAKIDPSLGFGGLTIPIGYSTTEPDQVAFLWEQVRQRIQAKLHSLNNEGEPLTLINKQLQCEQSNLKKLIEDESEQRLQDLLNKFNC